jgi:hypothetical protein
MFQFNVHNFKKLIVHITKKKKKEKKKEKCKLKSERKNTPILGRLA